VGVALPRCGKDVLWPPDPHEQYRSRLALAAGCPGVLLVYGEERANAALIGELEQDGYQVRRASETCTGGHAWARVRGLVLAIIAAGAESRSGAGQGFDPRRSRFFGTTLCRLVLKELLCGLEVD
jgi:hypothetical protein